MYLYKMDVNRYNQGKYEWNVQMLKYFIYNGTKLTLDG